MGRTLCILLNHVTWFYSLLTELLVKTKKNVFPINLKNVAHHFLVTATKKEMKIHLFVCLFLYNESLGTSSNIIN